MTVDRPGFADPVAQAQTSFRAVLRAMSEPGQIADAGAGLLPPSPLAPAAAALLLTLVDGETPLWLDPAAASAEAWIAFHCGAPPALPAAAMFALSLGLPDVGAFNAGSDEAPEQGATLIVQLPALGRGRRWRLTGPGIADTASLHVEGLPDDFAARWARNAALFPRGVDLILCAGQAVASLPRTVQVA